MKDRTFEMLSQIQKKQIEMAENLAAVQNHLKDINGSVKGQKEFCRETSGMLENDVNKLKVSFALATGGLSGAMTILAVLSYIGVL